MDAKMEKLVFDRQVPTTMVRMITKDIGFITIRMWHSASYAGEQLTKLPFSPDDGSGCMVLIQRSLQNGTSFEDKMCPIPLTVTSRIYFRVRDKNNKNYVSAILSYPKGIGIHPEYFWEIYPYKDDIKRFFGNGAETRMEKVIIRLLQKKVK